MQEWFSDILKLDKLDLRGDIYFSTNAEQVLVSYEDKAHDALFDVEDKSFWFKHRNRVIEAAIRAYPPHVDAAIIELGAGNGNTAYYLRNCGFMTAMFEPGIRGCKNAVKRGMKNIVCSLMNTDYVKENSVPAIGMFDVLEHIEDDVQFLTDLRKLLSDNGMLYITVPAHKALMSSSDAGHFRRYGLKQLLECIKRSGYETLYHTFFFRFLPLPIFCLRALPYRLRKPRNNGGGGILRQEFVIPAFAERLINFLHDGELKRIRQGKATSFGASIFAAARKINEK